MVLMQELASFDFGFGDKDKGHGKVQKAFIRFCRADRRASLPARPNDLDTGLEPSTSESQASTSFQRSDSLAPTGSQKTADTSRSPSFLAIPSLSNRKYGASEADTTRLSPTLTRAASSRKVVGFSALSSSPTTSRNGTSAPSRTSDSTPATGVDELGANDFSDSPEELDLETVLENEQRLGIGTMQRTIGQCLQAYQSEPDLPSVVRKGGLHG
ncbi:hypothetical protein H2203_008600 [Taxawa tesnikishii (nom. ined.)]|nr:hypothetical protein H2203_008600 [Dothideales sp. JES 119]